MALSLSISANSITPFKSREVDDNCVQMVDYNPPLKREGKKHCINALYFYLLKLFNPYFNIVLQCPGALLAINIVTVYKL